jgi:hypothetical protein
MATHVADRILSTLKSRMASVSGITGAHLLPLHMLDISLLPAIVIDQVRDTVTESTGVFPVYQTHKLQITVKLCIMATESSFDASLGTLHEATAKALTGSVSAITLGSVLTRGLRIDGEELFADSESLQKPVGGWAIEVSCIYNTRSDQPGNFEKELT